MKVANRWEEAQVRMEEATWQCKMQNGQGWWAANGRCRGKILGFFALGRLEIESSGKHAKYDSPANLL